MRGYFNRNMLSRTSSNRELDLHLSVNESMNVVTRPTRTMLHSEIFVLMRDIRDCLPNFNLAERQPRQAYKKV